MSKRYRENENDFKAQSYFRLLGYTKPYWKRMTVGLVAGVLVGGSLLASLLMVPQLVGVLDPAKAVATRVAISEDTKKIVALLEANPEWSRLPRETRLNDVETILNPTIDETDPKFAAALKRIGKYAADYQLPLKVSRTEVTITWPRQTVIPIMNADGQMAWQVFAIYAIGFVLIWAFKNLATYLNHYCMRWVGAKVIADMRDEVFTALTRQSLAFYGKMDVGHLISRCTNDTAAIESAVADSIADATRCPIELLACATAIVIISLQYENYILLLVLLIGTPLVILPVLLISKRIRRVYRASFAKIADVVTRMHETFTGILVVKSYNMEAAECEHFAQINRKYLRANIRAMRLQLLMDPLMETIAMAGSLAFLIYAYSHNVTLTALTALMAPAFMAYQPVKKLSKLTTYIQRSMAGADRYFALIDTHTELPERAEGVKLAEFKSEIRFNGVKFGYDERNILDGIDFAIPKGSVVAVVGETGSGKTTIANLIARFYDVREGSVTIDGVDVRDMDVKALRKLIGIVSQEAILFNETIADNIAYGCSDATREAIVGAAQQANAHGFISDGRHELGYDTVVGEKGFRLSGGEKQRVAIARAILKNPPILILDEATSALDTVTERLVQTALNTLMTNRTVFAIAHRLSTIQNANLIIVLEHGKIIERGTHAELLALNGVYKKLHDTQFSTADGAEA